MLYVVVLIDAETEHEMPNTRSSALTLEDAMETADLEIDDRRGRPDSEQYEVAIERDDLAAPIIWSQGRGTWTEDATPEEADILAK